MTAQKMKFQTELEQLLHLITHSLYSNKEIFLRELISNASDAINKIRFDALSHEHLLEGDTDWKIHVRLDPANGTLTISDNGIGLSPETAVENLGTIARSGTRVFLESLKQKQAGMPPDLIGQFGVGFYSAFMVADRVTVLSRPAGDPQGGVRWESDGKGEFTVEPYEKAKRGSDVILHLKPSEKEFLEPYRLREIVRKFSDFIEHPVIMDQEKEENGEKKTVEEVINSRKAVWLRNKADNTAEDYSTFYKQISNDYRDPLKSIQYSAEGQQEFKALLFIPAEQPFGMQFGEYKWGLRLYIQRVLIMDHCEELLPTYLRFVKGVVDSSDLPLNISREILQSNPKLEQIKNNVTRTVLKALEELRDEDYDKYVGFVKQFSNILKEGPARDFANRDRIADLLLFESMNTPVGKYTTLAKYVESMPESQKDILFLIGETREQLQNSPYLEAARAAGQDVLLMTEPMDEWFIQGLRRYKDKSFTAVDGAIPPGTVSDDEKARFSRLLESLKSKLPEVADVRLSTRLKDSAACLVAGEHGVSAHMERLLTRHGREVSESKRILEINGSHPVMQALVKLPDGDARLESYARLLYDQAVIAEGSQVKDPVAFAKRINELLLKDAN
ncbi:MAG: molecular chaperone HtpG [Planctomycetia bacterium]|nr:molecular chaperone HtpG [Planctomycetia bacterium]